MNGQLVVQGAVRPRVGHVKACQVEVAPVPDLPVLARLHGLSYSRLIDGLKKAEVEIDRKVLADLAVHDAAAFGAIAETAKAALGR